MKKKYEKKDPENGYSVLFVIGILFIIAIFFFCSIDTKKLTELQNIPTSSRREQEFSQNPILITPSNVRLINYSGDEQQMTYSPGTGRRASNHSFKIVNSGRLKKTPKSKYVSRRRRDEFRSEGEFLTCQVVEELVGGEVLVNVRPDILKNPKTGKNLEFDVFCEELDFAVDYNGSYHYDEKNYFNKNKKSFEGVKERDKLKKKLAIKNGICLLIVPWTVDSGVKGLDGQWKYVKNSSERRKDLLRAYIEPFYYDHINSIEN